MKVLIGIFCTFQDFKTLQIGKLTLPVIMKYFCFLTMFLWEIQLLGLFRLDHVLTADTD